jgi:hypothetical protein
MVFGGEKMTSRRIYECDRCFKQFEEHKSLIKVKISNRKPLEICKGCLEDVDATLRPKNKIITKEKKL